MNPLLKVARDAIEAKLAGRSYTPPTLDDDVPKGAFVTLHGPGGRLRGCIGHMQPTQPTMAEQIAAVAVAAATQDPRFPPVDAAELEDLSLEISLLEPTEPAPSMSDLDPARWGLVVTSGRRRGVLLPGLDGVTDARHQLQITLKKARIHPSEPFSMDRFEVTKIAEADG